MFHQLQKKMFFTFYMSTFQRQTCSVQLQVVGVARERERERNQDEVRRQRGQRSTSCQLRTKLSGERRWRSRRRRCRCPCISRPEPGMRAHSPRPRHDPQCVHVCTFPVNICVQRSQICLWLTLPVPGLAALTHLHSFWGGKGVFVRWPTQPRPIKHAPLRKMFFSCSWKFILNRNSSFHIASMQHAACIKK